MESNGKSITKSGEPVNYETGVRRGFFFIFDLFL